MTLLAKRILGVLAAILVVVGAIAYWKYYTVSRLMAAMAAQKPQPTMVSSIKAAEETWQDRRRAVGSLAAVQGVTVCNELAGTVRRIAFESGDSVKAGDVLIALDTSTDEAQLRGLKAQAELARISLERAKELRQQNTNAPADLDAAQAQADQARAAVEALEAVIAKKVIVSPFAGRLGIRQVNQGQYLAAGSPIVALNSLDPIYVNFALPQQAVVDLAAGLAVEVRIDAYPGEVFTGAINAVAAGIDDATRNVGVQATLRNPGARLKPGMFASVEVLLPAQSRFVTLPQPAVVYNAYGNSVYVVQRSRDASGAEVLTASQRVVQLGESRGDQVAVLKGVQPGEEIVTSGQLKLRNGSLIAINNRVAVDNNPAPTPPNN